MICKGKTIYRTTCLGAASYLALAMVIPPTFNSAIAQGTLPPVTVDAPKPQAARPTQPSRRAARSQSATRRTPAPTPQQQTVQPGVRGVAGERANGPVVGYLASQSGTSTKTDTPILTTPQSISVVTKDQIADQGAQNLVEALRYTPGVTLDLYGATTFFDAIKLRGFEAPRYLDGLRLPLDPGTQVRLSRALRLTVLNGLKS